jgi:hypothetical protein
MNLHCIIYVIGTTDSTTAASADCESALSKTKTVGDIPDFWPYLVMISAVSETLVKMVSMLRHKQYPKIFQI